MSSRKSKRGKPKQKLEKVEETNQGKQRFASLLGVCTIIGTVAALLTFVPRPSVVPGDPVDPSDSMSASFTIVNTTFIPLWHVTAEVASGYLNGGKAPDSSITRTMKPEFATLGPRLVRPEWKDHTLNMDDRFTITPADLFRHAKEGEIATVVMYKPWILPLQREKVFRFLTYRQTNGNLYWYSLPSN
jgi:hypothetical protein